MGTGRDEREQKNPQYFPYGNFILNGGSHVLTDQIHHLFIHGNGSNHVSHKTRGDASYKCIT